MQPPAHSNRFYGIQWLRALAALLVVLDHLGEIGGALIPSAPSVPILLNGQFGVDIFFPISGFVMYLTAQSCLRHADWRRFAGRRLLRVVPPYYLLTLLMVVLILLRPSLFAQTHLTPWYTAASFLFLPVRNASGNISPLLPVGWTLTYEMLFYGVLTALIAWRLPLLRGAVVVLAPLAVLGFFIPNRWPAIASLASPLELEFLAGMAIAAALPWLRRLPWQLPALLAPVALALPLVVGFSLGLPRCLVWGIPGALLVACFAALEPHLRFDRWTTPLLLGDASYSLYLTHLFVLRLAGMAAVRFGMRGALGLFALDAAGLTCAVLVAVPFHLYVELPIIAALSNMRVSWSLRSAGQP